MVAAAVRAPMLIVRQTLQHPVQVEGQFGVQHILDNVRVDAIALPITQVVVVALFQQNELLVREIDHLVVNVPLDVALVDDVEGLIAIKGAVPGAKGSYVFIRDAVKKARPKDVPYPAATRQSTTQPAAAKADEAPAAAEEAKAE